MTAKIRREADIGGFAILEKHKFSQLFLENVWRGMLLRDTYCWVCGGDLWHGYLKTGCWLLIRCNLLGLFCYHAHFASPPPSPCGRGGAERSHLNTPFVLARGTPQPLFAIKRQHLHKSYSNTRKSCIPQNSTFIAISVYCTLADQMDHEQARCDWFPPNNNWAIDSYPMDEN